MSNQLFVIKTNIRFTVSMARFLSYLIDPAVLLFIYLTAFSKLIRFFRFCQTVTNTPSSLAFRVFVSNVIKQENETFGSLAD